MTNEEVDLIVKLFKCGKCKPIMGINNDEEKRYFMLCEKHKDTENLLDYLKKMNTH